MEKQVDIIIPLYDKWESIEYLVNILSKDETNNIIVVNDGYRDSGRKPKDRINVKYYYKKNGGFASAVNFGVNKGSASYLFIINTDIDIKGNIVRELLECMKDYDAVMPAIYGDDGRVESLGMKRIIGNMWLMRKRELDPLDALPFTAVMIKRSVWQNGLDEDYFMYYEDIDFFCTRKINIGVCKDISIVHFHSKSVRHKYYLQHRSRWLFWKKHSKGLPLWYFGMYIFWDMLSILRSIYRGYFIDALEARLRLNHKKSL